ncbi:MAG TPA: hypothetical protein PKK43_10925 [Spirochaetota bacterium]|nr:hypothetical protein [Spirochaetota bacterium]
MSPIGGILMGILLITGIILAGGNYSSIGISKNVWIGVNIAILVALIAYEIVHRIKEKNTPETENTDDQKKD